MRAKINDTEIYFDVEGPELEVADGKLKKRPTLIALHGGPGFDHGYLKPGIGPLRQIAQVVFVDLRGQGRSGRPSLYSCTLEQMADDVSALCDLLGIERPVLFGHSAGGFVALHIALRHPRLASGLVLCDTSPTLAPIVDDQAAPDLASRAGPEALAAAARFFGGDVSRESVEAFSRHVTPFYAAPSHMDVPGRLIPLSDIALDVMQYFFGKLAPRYDVRPKLDQINIPTLIVVGRYDWVCPPAASRAMARAIPGAELVELADSGHFGFSEEPEPFRAAVAGFLEKLGAAESAGS